MSDKQETCLKVNRLFPGLLALAGLVLMLGACGELTTPAPVSAPVVEQITVIPTFTAAPAPATTPVSPTPTLIVVPATSTPVPTATPAPTSTPTIVVAPTPSPLPVPTRPAQPAIGAFRVITVEQARNLNGYRALLPGYLPSGYQLTRLSYNETTQPRLLTILSEYGNEKGDRFYLSAQAAPGVTVATPITPTGGSVAAEAPAVLPPTIRPTALSSTFRQESLKVRGQEALLSYSELQTALSWSEPLTRYFINGSLSKEEIIKVAESLQ